MTCGHTWPGALHVDGEPVKFHNGVTTECVTCGQRWQLVAAAWREIPADGSHAPATAARETAVRKPRRWFR